MTASASASKVGEGVLISDTEKRPFTVGVPTPESDGALTSVTPGFSCAGEVPLDLGEVLAGVTAFGEATLDLGDFGLEDLDFGDFCTGDVDLGVLFPGDVALGDEDCDCGDFLAEEAALGKGDADFDNFFPGGVLGEATLTLGDFLGDGVFDFTELFS